MDISKKINQTINKLKLDLRGKIVLTEAATGPYCITPIIAALAGAKVFAFTKNTKYGTTKDVTVQTNNLIKETNNILDIEIITELDRDIINKADIITNSGHLRPLNKLKLHHTKTGVVIPLMYENWELRNSDIDLDYCKNNDILVAGTNEQHPDIDMYGYLGDMCMKLILDSGNCLYNSTLVLLSNNDFGPSIVQKIAPLVKRIGIIDTNIRKKKYSSLDNADWLGTFPTLNISKKYSDADAIILSAYPFDHTWIGNVSEITIKTIKSKFSSPLILRFMGDIDTNDLDHADISYYPSYVNSGHMGILPSDIGYDPVIRLQTAGLKVGQLLSQNIFSSSLVQLLGS